MRYVKVDGGRAFGSLTDLVAAIRSSLVVVTASSSSGCASVATSHGLLVTTHHAVWYANEVVIEAHQGARVMGRVVSVDVGRDLAFVAPQAPLELPPLTAASQPPRVGDAIVVVRRVEGDDIAVGTGVVLSVAGDHEFEVDAVPGTDAPGAVVVTPEGKLLGIAAPERNASARTVRVVGIRAIDGALATLDRPLGELSDRTAVYRCFACDDPFDVEFDRCLSCGTPLPHAAELDADNAPAHRIVKKLLGSLGVVANKVRTGSDSWRLVVSGRSTNLPPAVNGDPSAAPATPARVTEVVVRIGDAGKCVVFRAPICRLPDARPEPLFRLLLTLNDQTTGSYRFYVAGRAVFVSLVESTWSLHHQDAAGLVRDLVRIADLYRRAFAEAYAVQPLFDARSAAADG